jgi:hypothetical protein
VEEMGKGGKRKKQSRRDGRVDQTTDCWYFVGPTPEGAISHFKKFSGEAKNCFLEEKRRFIKKISTTEL